MGTAKDWEEQKVEGEGEEAPPRPRPKGVPAAAPLLSASLEIPGNPFARGGRAAPHADPSRLERLFQDYGAKVFRLALRCGLDQQEAEDGVQEVFLKVQRRLDTFRGEAKLSTWLYQVALHTLLDQRRRSLRQGRAASLQALTDERGETAVEDAGQRPHEQAAAGERAALVRRALDRLPRKFREVMVLRELEGLCYRDIARILGVAQGTVESRIFRARERLAQELRHLEASL